MRDAVVDALGWAAKVVFIRPVDPLDNEGTKARVFFHHVGVHL